MQKIDENLNAVFPVVTERVTRKEKDQKSGEEKEIQEDVVHVWAYHAPISRAVFMSNYRLLAATRAALSSKGAHYLMSAGPRIAALTLRDEGLRDAEARGYVDEEGRPREDEVRVFFAELKRLTTILCPGPNGWEMLPVDNAISSGRIDEEDWEEALSSAVFFICHWSMAKRVDRTRVAQRTASFLNALITSLPLSESDAFLPKSTPAETSAKPAVSSVPS